MNYEYIGDYMGYGIERRDNKYNAVGWDCYSNCAKVYHTGKTLHEVERAIDKQG